MAGFVLEGSMATSSSCHSGTATLDVSADMAGFRPLVHGDNSSGTQIVAFLV